MPPYLRTVEASACENAWNIRPNCSRVMPMPVSRTCNTIHAPSRAASSVIVPRSVNLLALLSRLNNACRTFVRSARIVPSAGEK